MSEIVITPSDQGRTFEANPGELIVIHLEGETGGYQWEVGAVNSQIIEFLDSDYSPPPETRGVGGAGTRTFRFRAKSSGRGKIQLRLRRAWEPEDAAIERFEVNIRVQ